MKGKGGVFKVTWGLQREFGSDRVFNSPLAEANIVGRAIGMALRGLKPVVEIQFFDYIWPAYMQIRDELATMRWRSNNTFASPVVIRAAYGGYISGGAVYHSQTGAVLFTANPGLRVVCPQRARCQRTPAHGHPLRGPRALPGAQAPLPADAQQVALPRPRFVLPFGKAALVREGRDVTVVTYGATVYRALQAARQAEEEGLSLEILDLRTLSPVDWEAIEASARKTSKVLVLPEDSLSFGYGAELAARIGETLYDRAGRARAAPGRHRHLRPLRPRARGLRAAAGGRHPEGGARAGGLVGTHFFSPSSSRSIQPSSAAARPVTVPV